jgi:hypothetical protein
MWICIYVPTFRENLLTPSSGYSKKTGQSLRKRFSTYLPTHMAVEVKVNVVIMWVTI